jgi:hypothetical protein
MRILNFFPAILLLCALPCLGQHVEVIPDIAIAEAEYRDANEACLQNDPSLERDLFTADPEQVRRRIHRAASLRDDAMAKKEVYLKAVILRLQNLRSRLSQGENGTIPTGTLRKSLEAQQAHTLDEQVKVEGQLRDLPEGDEYLLVRRALDEERTNLINLQNNIAQRIRSLESIDKAQQAIQSASGGDSLAQKLDEVVKLWGQERDSTTHQRSHWAQLYTAMEQALDKKGPQPGTPRKASPKKPSGSAAPAPGSLPPSVRAAGFAGTWAYRSQPGAWTGYGEPEKVTLELRPESDTLRGTYTARLAVRSGFHDVQLALAGPRRSGSAIRLHWISQTPAAEGEMDLKLGTDGRLLVERSQSGDGYIPRGMEVLLPQ